MLLKFQEHFREYQHKALRFLKRAHHAALLLDMGLGKTISVLTLIKWLLLNPQEQCSTWLVVAPIRVMKGVWKQEAWKWKHTRDIVFSVVHGGHRKRIEALETPAHIYLINPEGLVWLIEMLHRLGLDKPGKWPFQGLAVDESSMFKSASTKRFKALHKVLHLFKRRIIMTGTPTPNSMLEFWPQMCIVDMGARLGTSFYRFRERYFESEDFNAYTWRLRRGAREELNSRVRDCVLRLDANDWFQLPPLIENRVDVELPDHVMEMYEQFEEELFIEMATMDVESVSAAALSMKCQQIANGAIYGDDRTTGAKAWEPIHDCKLDALQEIIDETNGNILVAYKFKHDLARLRAKYPKAPVASKMDIIEFQDNWNKGRYPVGLVHWQSIGHGVQLAQGGHTLAAFSLTWSRELYDQLVARIGPTRQAQLGRNNQPVTVHSIVARDTVDEAILLSCHTKGTGQRDFLNMLKEYRDAKQEGRQLKPPTEFARISGRLDDRKAEAREKAKRAEQWRRTVKRREG